MPRETRDQKIARLAYEYKMAKKRESDAKAEADAYAAELKDLVPLFTDTGTLTYDEFDVTVKHTRGERSFLDEAGLFRALPSAKWNKISRRMVDQDLLASHIKSGDISEELVKKFTTITPNASYVNITMKKRS